LSTFELPADSVDATVLRARSVVAMRAKTTRVAISDLKTRAAVGLLAD
jgi:hypothetical protein